MTFPTKTFGACAAIALLSACGGGGGGGPQTAFTYQTLGSPAPGTSDVAAVGLEQGEGGVATDTRIEVGTLDRESRQLRINGILIDGAFDQEQNIWTDGTTFVAESGLFSTNGFQFLLPVTVSATNGDNASNYIIGVVSRLQDVPTTGQFTFRGDASVGGVLENPYNQVAGEGDLVLTARFAGTRGVDVTLENFDGNLPFDRVQITGMTIATSGPNATFSGGTITFIGPDVPVTLSPGATTSSASGAFFGGDTNGPSGVSSGPTEVGGVFTVIGSDNINNIFGIFAGNRTNP
jgi:hypothetical protein